MRPALVALALLGGALVAPARLATPAFAAPEPKAVATASKTEVSVGERFTIEVRASGPAGAVFAFVPGAATDSIELVSVPADSAALPAGGQRYRAAVFALGDARVPPIPVRYRLPDGTSGAVMTAAIPLHVVSLLPRERGEQKLSDVRAPVPLAIGRAFWIGLAVALLAVAGLVWWLLSRRPRAAPVIAAAVPELEPDLEARRALDALIASGRLARGEYRPYYIELTAIGKRYLERRLGAPIVEMTTAEMLAHLRAAPAAADLVPTLRDLTAAADQIKFARGDGLTEAAERHLAATRALIDSLETRLRPAATEGGAAA